MGLSSSPKFPHDDDDDRTMLLPSRAAPGIRAASPAPSVELNDLQPLVEHTSDQVTEDGDPLGETQKLAEEFRAALSQLKNDLEAEKERKRKEDLGADARGRRLRSRWFPWLAVALMTNLLLWLTMIYLIFRVQEYSIHRSRYLVITWTIFMIPLLIFLFLLLSPYPLELRRRRIEVAAKKHTTNYLSSVNVANASCCFTLVIIYLYASALPQYNSPKWEAGVDFVKDLTLPAFSFAVPSLTFSPVDIAQFDVDTFVCNELVQGTGYERCSEAAYSGTPIELNIDARPGSMSIGAAYNFSSLAYIYNSTILNPNTTTLNLAEVFLTATVNYSNYNFEFGEIFLEVAFFDPRINLTDAVACGLVQMVQIPHAATNIFYITAERITDTLGMIVPPATERCTALYKEALSQEASPYMSFGFSLSSEYGGDFSVCKSNACVSTAKFSYASHVVHTLVSKHGIDQLTIWLNCSAIVGAVQFFAWFFGIFNL